MMGGGKLSPVGLVEALIRRVEQYEADDRPTAFLRDVGRLREAH